MPLITASKLAIAYLVGYEIGNYKGYNWGIRVGRLKGTAETLKIISQRRGTCN